MEEKDHHFKLFYNTVRRLGDLVGVLLLIAAILFGLRGFF
jgi:hypothetical protein